MFAAYLCVSVLILVWAELLIPISYIIYIMNIADGLMMSMRLQHSMMSALGELSCNVCKFDLRLVCIILLNSCVNLCVNVCVFNNCS